MEQKRWNFIKKYIGWGVTIIIVSALVLLLFFCFYKFDSLKKAFGSLMSILAPVIYGLVIAYLLSPIYEWLSKKLVKLFSNKLSWTGRKADMTAMTISMFLTFTFMFIVVIGLLAMVVPRLITSITGIVATLPSTMNTMSASVQEFISGLTGDNSQAEANVMSLYVQAVNYVENWLQNSVVPQIEGMFSYFTGIVLNFVKFLKDALIGIVVAVYLLANKPKFIGKAKKLLYAIFGVRYGNFLMDNARFANEAFGGFLIGKIVDSAIIGLITGVVLPIMNMPYSIIIAVVVGVTNIIPFFGPFIGAIPCAILVFIVSPFKSLQFIIYIFIIQQFDGNVLGPKILGNTTGISSFGVLFSIILFGGLFGFVGMIIGVPLFVVITHLVTDFMNLSLDKKDLPKSSTEYIDLDTIDDESNTIIHKQPEPEPVIVNDKRGRKKKKPDNSDDDTSGGTE